MTPVFTNTPTMKPDDPRWTQKRQFLTSHGYNEDEATQMLSGGNPIQKGTVQFSQPQASKMGAGMAQKGLAVSPDALEALRAEGAADDFIADQMAQSSSHFASQLKKIRTKFNNDGAATTAFLNTRFYGDTSYTPEPSEKKGYVGRTLDRVYGHAQAMRQALDEYNTGQINAGQAVTRSASSTFRGIVSPATEFTSTAFGAAVRGASAVGEATGATDYLKGVGNEIAQSNVGQAVAPYAQAGIEGVKGAVQSFNELPEGSYWRDAAAVGMAGVDALDVYGTGKVLGYGGKLGVQSARHPFQTVRHPVKAAKLGLGTKSAPVADDVARQLTGKAKEAVNKGMDEKFMTFVAEQQPDTRAVMSKMTKAAHEGGKVLGGTVKHKEILGGQMMENLAYVLDEKKAVGTALGAMKKAVADAPVNLTDDYVNLVNTLRSKGAVMNDKGKIMSLAGAADDNIPLLQKTLDFFQPDDAGNVVRSGKEVDMWRQKMFQEMNSAKAKLQPSAAGQSTLGFAEKVTNDLRRASLKKMAKGNKYILVANDTFEELSTEASKFLKSIQYKGKLDIDSITAKELRAGEIALRTLGNASAESRDAFTSLIQTARKHGRVSGVDEMALIRYADALEDVFPITPTRSLQGGVSRGTRDALGNLTEDVVGGSSLQKSLTNRVAEPVMKVYDRLRGLTPENRFKLLMEVLDSPPETEFFTVMQKALPKDAVDDIGKAAVNGVDAGDMKPIAKAELSGSPALSPAGSRPGSPAGQSRLSGQQELKASSTTIPQSGSAAQGAMIDENRLVGAKGGNMGTPGIDFATAPPAAIPNAWNLQNAASALGTTPDKLSAVVKSAGSDLKNIEQALRQNFGSSYDDILAAANKAVDDGTATMGALDIADPLRQAVFGQKVTGIPPTK